MRLLRCLATQALPFKLSVAAVKKFVWRADTDIIFHYRVMDPACPALLPDIRPQ